MAKIEQWALGPIETNCYFLGCETTRRGAIIDPAWDSAAIADRVARDGYTITHILLTHTHFDHVAGLAELKAATGAPIYAHPEAVPMLHLANTTAQLWGITFPTPPGPDQLLAEGDVLKIGELEVRVLFTPGHAPGHVSFYAPAAGAVFSGDVLFNFSIGRTDLPGSNYPVLIASIQTQLLTLPDATLVLSGHGPQTTIGFERENNPFLS